MGKTIKNVGGTTTSVPASGDYIPYWDVAGNTTRHSKISDLPVTATASTPLTTKGDLYGFSTVGARIPVGANGYALVADNTQALGVKWASVGGTGTVTSASVVSANGFTGSVATATTTPALTLGTSLTGILVGNGTAMTAATTSAGISSALSDNTGTGALVFGTSPTLVTPVLGVATATSINKVTITAPTTSATLTLVTGSSLITSGAFAITLTSTATTNVTLPTTGTLATTAGVETYTNKNLASSTNTLASVTTTASTATPAPTGSSRENDMYITASTVAMTVAAPSGTPANGNKLTMAFFSAAAQTLAFNAIFAPLGVTLPTTTVAGKWLYVSAKYNSTAAKWHVLAVGQEA